MPDVPLQLGREGMATIGESLQAFFGVFEGEYRRRSRREDEELMLSPAEMQLAIDLRRENVFGWRQQEPLGPYSADFWFPFAKVAVEVDGREFHDRERDRHRDEVMRDEFGVCSVLRIAARRIMRRDTTVIDEIRAEVEKWS